MKVVRTQWPVGQGCFATGTIESRGGSLHYVYDCGARNVTNLEPIVAAYARQTPRVDALFISHLDGDHVDGLDVLLARVDVGTVYLPYLSASQRLLQLAGAESNSDRLTASLVQAQFEPARWFGSRGVRRVVFVRNGGEETDLLTPPSDPLPPSERIGEGGPQSVFVERSRIVEQATDDDAVSVWEMDVNEHIGVYVDGSPADWILRPHVPRVSDGRAERFMADVLRALGRNDADPIDQEALRILLKTPTGRAKLRKCYDNILTDGGGEKHNAVSMSLYSGPRTGENRWQMQSRIGGSEDIVAEGGGIGWIGAGDAKLKSGDPRAKWLKYYDAELARTSTLLLPHHGSKANFHAGLIRPSVRVCIASADERHEGYRHPSPEVAEEIETLGRTMVHVTKRFETRFTETMTLSGPR